MTGENNVKKTIPVNIYCCNMSGGNFTNTHQCYQEKSRCDDLLGPIETIDIPIEVLERGNATQYLSEVSKRGSVLEQVRCRKE
jgi:hypothetical protein